MGIQGLLPLLKSIHEHRKIHEFNGQTLAVDAYVWLHRGAYGCAPELVKGIPTTRYVDYAMHRVRLLKHHNITPFIVFDGGPLPAKQGTESSRHKSREEARERAMELSRQGRHSEARDAFVKAVDVTPEMAYQLIKALRAENVSYVVAPYEADAQMAYLERTGIVDGIVTEDSDLLVFGCKKVILKLDSDGNCVCIRRENFARVVDLPLHGWSDKQFREMAMLSGCDYLASIQGLGLKTSHKLLRRHKTVEGVLNALRIKGSHTIPPNYLKDFRTAELAFIHQRVFDPITQQLTHLTPVPESLVDWRDSYVGKELAPEIASGIAFGSVHPFTMLAMPDINPSFRPEDRAVASFTRPKGAKNATSVAMTNPQNRLTNYFSAAPRAQRGAPDKPEERVVEEIEVQSKFHVMVGGGKRTLTAEHDLAKQIILDKQVAARITHSKFFAISQATPEIPTPQGPEASLPQEIISLVEDDEVVTQEPGYLSPQGSVAELIDVSSPPSSPDASDVEDSGSLADDSSDDDVENIPSPQRPARQFTRYAMDLTLMPALSQRLSPPIPTPRSPTPKRVVRRHSAEVLPLEDGTNVLNSQATSEGSSQSTSTSTDVPSASSLTPSFIVTPLAKFVYAPPTEAVDDNNPSPSTPPRQGASSQSQTSISDSSWGPDLQDIFSPTRSEAESMSSDIPSPERSRSQSKGKARGTFDDQDDDDVDVYLTPRKGKKTAEDHPDEISDDGDDDEVYFVGQRTASERKASVEAKWREKWAFPGPSAMKRKTDAISPRSEPQTKRFTHGNNQRETSPSPPERPRNQDSVRPRQKPRTSLPFPINASQTFRKPIPRRNATSFPAPTIGTKKKASGEDSATNKTLDLDSFRHQPLRLR